MTRPARLVPSICAVLALTGALSAAHAYHCNVVSSRTNPAVYSSPEGKNRIRDIQLYQDYKERQGEEFTGTFESLNDSDETRRFWVTNGHPRTFLTQIQLTVRDENGEIVAQAKRQKGNISPHDGGKFQVPWQDGYSLQLWAKWRPSGRSKDFGTVDFLEEDDGYLVTYSVESGYSKVELNNCR